MSVDQSVVDFDLPEKLTSFATTTIQLLAIIGVMCQSTWQVLILILPMAAAGLWLQVGFIFLLSFNIENDSR